MIEGQNTLIAEQRIAQAIANEDTHLDLSKLKLCEIPATIVHAESIEELYLQQNELTQLPSEVLRLPKLKKLVASNNKINFIPRTVRQLSTLNELDLCDNKLHNLPRELGTLRSLKRLYLNKNNLVHLPRAIRNLKNLEDLQIADNRLERLYDAFEQFTNLRNLDLHNNNLGNLPSAISKLAQLEDFNLSHNRLSTLPRAIGKLSNLRQLHLNNNNIYALPSTLSQLDALNVLDISANNITSLPSSIYQLKNLRSNQSQPKGLNISNNRLSIPEEILQREPEEIFQYVLDLQRSKRNKPLHEAKLVFIGAGFVGKTSLINMLINGKYNRNEQKTDGIDIRKWQIQRGEDTIKLRIWDFGGQEIMHATHRFFMTSRTAYVLVINPRSADNYGDSELEYWLKLIRSYAGDVPIVVAINKCETHAIDLPKGSIKDKYPNVIGFVETSCHKNLGLAALKTAITNAVATLEHIDDVLPKSYFEIKHKLEEINEDYIPYTTYEGLCKDVAPDFTQGSMRALVGLLHDLGIMLNFNEDRRLRDTQVLNPEWVTKGVYQIISSQRLINRKGILTVNDISKILDTNAYPSASERFYIMDMMDRFDLSYQIPDTKDTYYVPGAFSVDRPDTINWNYVGAELLRFQYHYDVLPSSIMSRFIVKVHDFIRDKDYWRNGIVLEKGHCTALIKADAEERKIFIEVVGEGNKRELLAFIRAQFDVIHNRLNNLKIESKIPVHVDSDVVLDYDDLLFYEEMGMKEIPVKEMRSTINIQTLLEGVSSAAERQQMRNSDDGRRNLVNKRLPRTMSLREGLNGQHQNSPIPLGGANPENSKWRYWLTIIFPILLGIIAFLANLNDLIEFFNRFVGGWK